MKGIVRTDLNKTGISYKDGNPVVEPHEFNTPITLPKDFGHTMPVSDATLNTNPVSWSKSPEHFGNAFSSNSTPTLTWTPAYLGSISFTTTVDQGGGVFLITAATGSINGSTITSVSPINSFGGNDNLFTPAGLYMTGNGITFATADGKSWNFYWDGANYILASDQGDAATSEVVTLT